MSDTPKTDAVMVDPNRDGNDLPNLARQLERELAACRTALESIAEYWNRDQNENAMADACWYAINTAEEALAATKGDEP